MQSIVVSDRDMLDRAEELARRRGVPVAEVVREALQAGLERLGEPGAARRYRTRPRPMGARPECGLDNIQELLARAEGEAAR